MRILDAAELDRLTFDPTTGLLPVVTQDARTGSVLMLAWADRAALQRTLDSGDMWYWSRSRGELWHKGGTSGNTQRLVALWADCDADALLALVVPAGPACHTGEDTCFGGEPTLAALGRTIESRVADAGAAGYTKRLLGDENLRAKKLGEEAAELVLACAKGEHGRVAEESADLIYHVLVAARATGVTLAEILAVLAERRSGRAAGGTADDQPVRQE